MEFPQRKNHRLKGYDYGSYGYYFVTICTHQKQKLLSTVVGSDALVAPFDQLPIICPTTLGQAVLQSWHGIETHNTNVKVGCFVMMPNHIHGIIIIENQDTTEPANYQYDFQVAERRGRRSLQGLLKDFKSVTTRVYKRQFDGVTSLWQDGFYDRIIGNEAQYYEICNYILENPQKWKLDPNCI